jgi:hypothetical protein
MSRKFILAALCAALSTGCASVKHDSNYAPVATSPSGLQVRGELVDLTDVKIFVNGQKVIDQQLALLSGHGKFDGSYGGKRVLADCSSKSGLALAKTRCVVSVGPESGLTLAF